MRKVYPCKYCGSKPVELHKVGCPVVIGQVYVDTGKRN
jgi:hypothetical protein